MWVREVLGFEHTLVFYTTAAAGSSSLFKLIYVEAYKVEITKD